MRLRVFSLLIFGGFLVFNSQIALAGKTKGSYRSRKGAVKRSHRLNSKAKISEYHRFVRPLVRSTKTRMALFNQAIGNGKALNSADSTDHKVASGEGKRLVANGKGILAQDVTDIVFDNTKEQFIINLKSGEIVEAQNAYAQSNDAGNVSLPPTLFVKSGKNITRKELIEEQLTLAAFGRNPEKHHVSKIVARSRYGNKSVTIDPRNIKSVFTDVSKNGIGRTLVVRTFQGDVELHPIGYISFVAMHGTLKRTLKFESELQADFLLGVSFGAE